LTFLTHILATICGLAGALIVNALSLKVFRMFENFNSIIHHCVIALV